MRPPGEFLDERVRAGDLPGACWLIGDAAGVLDSGSSGFAVLVPAPVPALDGEEGTIYDLASLTKPLVTSPLAIVLAREAGFSLGDPARRFLPEFDRLDKRDITLTHLLTHTSGLPDWAPLYLAGRSVPEYLRQISDIEPLDRPGARVRYSDLGYIALGAILERAGTAPLEALARSFLLEPLGSSACFRPPASLVPRVAATEESCQYERRKSGAPSSAAARWREGVIRGEVHDQNAWAAGGVAGHAGLFGTTRDVYRMAREAIAADLRVLRGRETRMLTTPQTSAEGDSRSLAYRINRTSTGEPDKQTAAGGALPPEAFGHNGFTGTSVWIDPRASRVYVLLTNRVHPAVREDLDMNALRREFHRLAAGA